MTNMFGGQALAGFLLVTDLPEPNQIAPQAAMAGTLLDNPRVAFFR